MVVSIIRLVLLTIVGAAAAGAAGESQTVGADPCLRLSPPAESSSNHDRVTSLGSRGKGPSDIHQVDARVIERPGQSVLADGALTEREPVAEIFAPRVISTPGDEAILTVVGGGSVLYLTRSDPGFDGPWTEIPAFRSERRGGEWSEPERVGTPGEPWVFGYREAGVGERVHFAWTPHLDGSGAAGDIDIWSVEMTTSGWSEPGRLAPPINLDGIDSWPSVADSGSLYFFSNRPGGRGQGDLYRVADPHAAVPVVEHLGGGVNSPAMEHDPCVAADERFVVFASNRPGGFGGNDLYVTFRTSSGGWSEPLNLGPAVNSENEDARPVLSSDGESLFFTRQSATGMDVYRVPLSVINSSS